MSVLLARVGSLSPSSLPSIEFSPKELDVVIYKYGIEVTRQPKTTLEIMDLGSDINLGFDCTIGSLTQRTLFYSSCVR